MKSILYSVSGGEQIIEVVDVFECIISFSADHSKRTQAFRSPVYKQHTHINQSNCNLQNKSETRNARVVVSHRKLHKTEWNILHPAEIVSVFLTLSSSINKIHHVMDPHDPSSSWNSNWEQNCNKVDFLDYIDRFSDPPKKQWSSSTLAAVACGSTQSQQLLL